MDDREVNHLLRQRPFEPLAFTFSDGSVEIVRRPEGAIVSELSVAIGQYEKAPERISWLKLYSMLHLVSVESSSHANA